MDLHYLDPALNPLLLNESHHLPQPNPNPNLNPNPDPAPDPNLRPVSSTAFKREARKKRKERKRVQNLEEKLESLLAFETHTRPSVSTSLSTIEWPCNEINSDPNQQPTGWEPVPDPNPKSAPPPPASLQAQQNALKQCQDFLSTNDESDDEDEEPFKFFVELFEKDGDLRGFYEKNWEKGDFCCLVCGGIGEKVGKRYGNCVGLVQHANTVSKTKKRGAHRDFGRAVCRVLGWDIEKLPGVFDGHLVRDGDPQEDIQKQIDIIEEVGPYKGVGDPIGPDKGDFMDYMQADANTD